jgi:hypothetical protein
MKKVTYKDIAEYIGKSEQQVKWYKKNNEPMLEILKTGAFCKKNGITIEMIKSCIELKEMAKGDGE